MKQLFMILVFLLGMGVTQAQKQKMGRYHANGKVQEVGYCIVDGEEKVKIGRWEEFSESGNLISIINYNQKGRRDGIQQTFYETGELKTTETYKNGLTESNKKEYYKNGKEVYVVKEKLNKTIKNTNINEHFTLVEIPADRQSLQLFKNPLKIEDCYFSGLRFIAPIDGYVYWCFQAIKNNNLETFAIVSTDSNNDDTNERYFTTRMAFNRSKDPKNLSDWIIQKSNVRLKEGQEYVIYFKSKEIKKPEKELLVFELKMSPTYDEKLSEFFKDSFDKVSFDY